LGAIWTKYQANYFGVRIWIVFGLVIGYSLRQVHSGPSPCFTLVDMYGHALKSRNGQLDYRATIGADWNESVARERLMFICR
jgi:hypothetical protein